MAARLCQPPSFAVAAFAQTSDRTFYTPHVQSPADLQTIVNVLRSVGDIQQVTPEFSTKADRRHRGNAAQLAFADWSTHELDSPTRGIDSARVPASPPPSPPSFASITSPTSRPRRSSRR